MATTSWSSGSLHDTDTAFRAWGLELSTKLQSMAGLVKTADSGQINWATVTRAAINTNAGYEIYYLNDSLHGTAPVYIKIWFGTGTVATNPRMTFEVGTGSNGSGTLTGLGLAAVQGFTTQATAGSATAANSYLCVASGFFGLGWKLTTTAGWLIIQRTCDGDGTLNGKGIHLMFRTLTTFSYATIRYEATAVASAVVADGYAGYVPQGTTNSSLQNGDKQIFLHWGMFPDMRPLWGTGVYVVAEFTLASTISVALVGASAHTYLTLVAAAYANANSATYGLAMLWE
jgi:hypothetical protein